MTVIAHVSFTEAQQDRRYRGLGRYRWITLILRFTSALCNTTTLIVLVACFLREHILLAVGLASATWTLLLDLLGLLVIFKKPTYLILPSGNGILIMVLETIAFIFAVIACLFLLLADVSSGAEGMEMPQHHYAGDPWRKIAFGLQAASAAVQLGLMVVTVVASCVGARV
ncbi:hypothetical protein BDV96DRAFT_595401 [Lophiotrema nucula]|uniref:MARVEL domain-containing protein n=1 Tax=Lophiotrema nucula TaxID=690887 RepID=A0A6A5ZRX6_9PLEO|nr:hypothetical protein BDV96DRAFT_595401 [Lophiotrema nucula]